MFAVCLLYLLMCGCQHHGLDAIPIANLEFLNMLLIFDQSHYMVLERV